MRFPIVVQLLHSVPALPDSSDKLSPVSVTFRTKRRPNRLSFSLKNGWQNKLRNPCMSPKLRRTVSIPEVILQSTFSRTVTSLSKQKQMNDHNSPTSTLTTKRVVHFIAESLLYPVGANNSILKICGTIYLFPDPVTYIIISIILKTITYSYFCNYFTTIIVIMTIIILTINIYYYYNYYLLL